MQRYGLEATTIAECSFFDRVHSFGYGYAAQLETAGKSISANCCDSIFQNDMTDVGIVLLPPTIIAITHFTDAGECDGSIIGIVYPCDIFTAGTAGINRVGDVAGCIRYPC